MNFLEKKFLYKDSKFIIVPAPLERTVSYGKGTASAFNKIIQASHELEEFDHELLFEPYQVGINISKEIIYNGDINKYYLKLSERVQSIVKDNKIPVIIGGEHSVSYPVFLGIKKVINDFSVLHFDAHLDLRFAYNGDKYSHASVIRQIKETGFNDITSFGIRSVSLEEHEYLKIKPHKVYYANDEINIDDLINNTKKNIYISFDVDCFDPSVVPSTGTPEPGGYTWNKTVNLLKNLLNTKNLIAFDIVELAPDNINHYSEFTIAKLIYKIMGYGQKR